VWAKLHTVVSKTSVHSAPVTVLVVDDHAPFRAVLKALLTQAGAEIAECGSAVEALRRFDEFQPSWVLMDVEMPEMDGITATRALKKRWPQTQVVIVTQYDDPDLRAEAARAGACAYVLKDDLTALNRIFPAVANAQTTLETNHNQTKERTE
jgi:two-component system response regulator DegU